MPYCEADYHAQYGVKCETCSRYISGRVLEVRTGMHFLTSVCVNSDLAAKKFAEIQIGTLLWWLSVMSDIRIEQLLFILGSL